MTSILLTGATGRLGKELVKLREFLAHSHTDMDITVPSSIAAYLDEHKPSLIVHAAGYVDSLKPENDAAEAIRCYETNVMATKHLVDYATCPIIYISTEGVVEPYNVYTLTKYISEGVIRTHHNYTIVRTNFWPRPFPFPKACDDLLTVGDYVDVVAGKINQLIDLPCENKVVYVGTGVKTVFDVARETVPDIEPVPCQQFGIPSRKGLLNI